MTFDYHLRPNHYINFSLFPFVTFLRPTPLGLLSVSEESISTLALGNKIETSSNILSTPGPTDLKDSSAPHFRQVFGIGIEKPVR